jgi:hypothetical protein
MEDDLEWWLDVTLKCLFYCVEGILKSRAANRVDVL